ncbi:MAG: glycosyltransferase family 2 protein, partial [Patescibacteria group bacterium]
KTGYPVVYNRGLREVKYSWVAFIDDDCVAYIDWFEVIKDSIKKYPGVSAILGQTDTYYNRNIFSLSTSFLENLWKRNRIRNKRVVDLEILDNRNIVYNQRFLSKNKIAFDESRVKRYGGSSEDCDLGMQVQAAGGTAIYESKMLVLHKDPVNGIYYFKKLVYSTKGHLSYERKWSEYRETISKIHTKVQSAKHLLGFLKGSKINFISKIILIVVIGLTFLVVKLTKLYEKN